KAEPARQPGHRRTHARESTPHREPRPVSSQAEGGAPLRHCSRRLGRQHPLRVRPPSQPPTGLAGTSGRATPPLGRRVRQIGTQPAELPPRSCSTPRLISGADRLSRPHPAPVGGGSPVPAHHAVPRRGTLPLRRPVRPRPAPARVRRPYSVATIAWG